jgi:very-short-patch-repair endonuclease
MAQSNAETALFQDLSRRTLTAGMVTNEMIILRCCFPDFMWSKQKLALFLDGPHHLQDKVEARDTMIDELLEFRGWTVLRFPYKPPLRKSARKAICELIEKKLKTLP